MAANCPEQVEIRQRKGGEQARGVFRQTAIAHLGEPPQPLSEHQKFISCIRSRARAEKDDRNQPIVAVLLKWLEVHLLAEQELR